MNRHKGELGDERWEQMAPFPARTPGFAFVGWSCHSYITSASTAAQRQPLRIAIPIEGSDERGFM